MNMNINDRCSISATIQQAVIENNEGTRLVRQCQYNSALKSFTSVLNLVNPLAAMLEDNDRFETDTDGKNDTDTTTSSSSTVPFVISFTNNNSITMHDTEEDSNDTTALARTKDTMNDLSSSPEASASTSAPESASYTHKSIASKDNCNNGTASPFSRKPKYFVFPDPVFILPESLPSRAATTRMITDDTYSNDDDIDDNDDDDDDDVDDNDFNELPLYSSEFFSKFLMIVMYNLALTLHLHALSLASSSSSSSSNVITTTPNTSTMQHVNKLFLQSRKLYELAFEMQLNANVDLLFPLALLNNLGLINYTLNAKDRSKKCFKHLFSTMMYLTDLNESQSIKGWDGLLSNAIDILQIGNAVAASAA